MTTIGRMPLTSTCYAAMGRHANCYDASLSMTPAGESATAFFAKTIDTSDKMLARPENDVQSTRTSFVFAMGKRKGRGGARENDIPRLGDHATVLPHNHGKHNLLEDDINPFINPDEESDVDIATSCVADTAGLGSIAPPSIPVSENDIASWLPAADIGEDRSGNPLPRAPVRSPAKRKHPLKLNRRLWEAPGPSPLSQMTFDLTAMAEEEYSSSSASVENLGSNDDEEEEFLRSFVRQHHLLKIHHLPRNFAGKKGRVAVSLWRTHLKRTLLSRIYELGVESPELDFVDEHSIEFLLDLQADLRRGHVTIPRLSTCNFAPPPSIGTSRRRVVWRAGQTFPRRVEDYSKAAARMLARHRALAST